MCFLFQGFWHTFISTMICLMKDLKMRLIRSRTTTVKDRVPSCVWRECVCALIPDNLNFTPCFKIKSVAAKWVDLNLILFFSTLEVPKALTHPLFLPLHCRIFLFLRRAASSQTHKQFRIVQCYLSEWLTTTISVWFRRPRSQMFDIYAIFK